MTIEKYWSFGSNPYWVYTFHFGEEGTEYHVRCTDVTLAGIIDALGTFAIPVDEFGGFIEQLSENGVDLSGEEILDLAKSNTIKSINAYDVSPSVNIFYLAGQPLWLDAATRQQLRISIEAYQAQGETTVTKWFGGEQYSFPTSLWLTMLNALEVYAGDALNATERHKATVASLDSLEDVLSYDYTTGYPEILNLTPQWLQQHI